MKKYLILSVLTAFLCFCGCSSPPPANVYRLYAEGKFKTTLTENNCYILTNAEKAISPARSPEPVIIFIGAAWCPYCAADIGVVDGVFRSSAAADLGAIYYIDAADSQISASTVMQFNEAFDATVPTTIPCVMYFDGGTLKANRNDPAFKQTENRTEQIRLFFDYVEKTLTFAD